ncbi:MAG: hypothetical protein ACO1OC_10970 [Tuberibacillus sp.]
MSQTFKDVHNRWIQLGKAETSGLYHNIQMKAHHPARIKKQKDDFEGLKTYIQSLEERNRALFDPNLDKQIHFLTEIMISLHTWSRVYSDHENIIVPEVYKNWASPETYVHNLKIINEYKG